MSSASNPVPDLAPFLQAQAWLDLNPTLHVADLEFMRTLDPLTLDAATGDALERLLVREGYFHVPPLDWGLPVNDMARAIVRLGERGLAPPFCYLYDEFWLIFFKLHYVLGRLLGDYWMLPDFWAWHIDPRAEQRGWRPHRDKGRAALFPGGRPKSLTVWLPLTEATPLNGCMYVVPADRDPTYGTEQENEYRFDLQDVRALPSPAGGIFCWNQAVLHWGARASPRAPAPRVSVAFEFQRADVPPMNQPLLRPLVILTVEQRLALVSKQVLQYSHMYPPSPGLQRFAEAVLQRPLQS